MTVRRRTSQAAPPDRRALIEEREALRARLAEIDRLLTRREEAVFTPPEHRGGGRG